MKRVLGMMLLLGFIVSSHAFAIDCKKIEADIDWKKEYMDHMECNKHEKGSVAYKNCEKNAIDAANSVSKTAK